MIDRPAGSVTLLAEAVFDVKVNSSSTLVVGTIAVPSVGSIVVSMSD
jgi:hypothetical protein